MLDKIRVYYKNHPRRILVTILAAVVVIAIAVTAIILLARTGREGPAVPAQAGQSKAQDSQQVSSQRGSSEETNFPSSSRQEELSSETAQSSSSQQAQESGGENSSAIASSRASGSSKPTQSSKPPSAPSSNAPPLMVTGVTISPTSLTLAVGESARLTASVSPSDAPDQSVLWSSSNPSVVMVNQGNVTAKSSGTAVITAKSTNGKTAACTVTVKADPLAAYSKPYDIAKIQADMIAYAQSKGSTYVSDLNGSSPIRYVDSTNYKTPESLRSAIYSLIDKSLQFGESTGYPISAFAFNVRISFWGSAAGNITVDFCMDLL